MSSNLSTRRGISATAAADAVAEHNESATAHGGLSGVFSPIKDLLARGVRSASLYVCGDSTAATSPALLTRWPGAFLAQLAATSPAFNIRLADFDGDSRFWRAERLMYAAPAGVRALRLYGQGVGNSVCPWRAATGAIATDFAVQMRVKFNALPTTYRWLAGRYSNPNTDWVFRIGTDLTLRLQDQTSGGVYWESTIPAPIEAGQTIWLGFYYFSATGEVGFYTSTAENALPFHEPSAGWTQLGTTVANGENRLSTVVNYGWTVGGPNLSPDCTVYNVRAYTVDGTDVVPVFVDDVDHWGSWSGAASHDDPTDGIAWNWIGAPTLTVRNASVGGWTYADHTTNAAKLFLDPKADAVLFAAHLNDPSGATQASLLDSLLAELATLCPRAGYALLTENPSETYREQPAAAAGYNSDHARRTASQVSEAMIYAQRAGWRMIDTFRRVSALPAPRTSDGIHPTEATASAQGAEVLACWVSS